jgi:hypothetical protein
MTSANTEALHYAVSYYVRSLEQETKFLAYIK